MYRLKRIWLKLRSHAGMYIFVWIQFVVIIYILSVEIGILHYNYDTTYFVEDYDDGIHWYANAGQTVFNGAADIDSFEADMQQFIEDTEKLDGVKGVGYYNVLQIYEMCGGCGMEKVIYLNDVMADISYKDISGNWLTKEEYSDE